MNRKITDALKYVLSAVLAAVMLYFSFRKVSWEDFVNGLESCRWEYVVMSMAAGVCAFGLRAVRWRQLILPFDDRVSILTTFNAVNIGYIANFVFPRIGEFVRCGVVSKDSSGRKASYDKVLGTVFLERSWDMFTMILLLVLVFVLCWDRFGAFFIDDIWTPAVERFDLTVWYLVATMVVLFSVMVVLIWHFRHRNSFCARVWKIAVGLLEGFSSCIRMDHKWFFFLNTVLIWGVYWMMAFLTMRALPQLDSLNMIDALFLSLVGSIGWVVPVPGGLGAFHFIVASALSVIYGIPFELGMIFATVSHESQAVTMAFAGGISYVSETFRKRS